jgi:integrase
VLLLAECSPTARPGRVDAQGKKIGVHALRHSLASRLARAGVPITHAQKLLGHATVEMTARVYTHLDEQSMRGAIGRIEPAEQLRLATASDSFS